MSRTLRNISGDSVVYESEHKSEIRAAVTRQGRRHGSMEVPDGLSCPGRIADGVSIDGDGKPRYDYSGSETDFHMSPNGHRVKKRETRRAERRFGRGIEKRETEQQDIVS